MSHPSGNPLIVAAAVVRVGDRVLITRRKGTTDLAGYWEFPGGKVERDEDPETAVVRECREECGIEIRVIDILDVTFHRYSRKNVLLLFYECELVSNAPVQHLDVADHAWCLPCDLHQYDFPEPDQRLIRKIVSGKRAKIPPVIRRID